MSDSSTRRSSCSTRSTESTSSGSSTGIRKSRRTASPGSTILGGPEHLEAIVRLLDVERVIIAFSNESHEELLELVASLRNLDVQVDIVPRLFEAVGPGLRSTRLKACPSSGSAPSECAVPRCSSSALWTW